ncbi:MAG: 3-deoxy-manno-octulosonate cytidylyltransferase [Bacteroidales bacterium]|nr:3-deoxy-manno-octulosonate cytidylyltransferase [Bacteroidales bacterium]
MTQIGIIPARFASTRFPGKPLAKIEETPMIEHVYRRASQALEKVFVATDDKRIYNTVLEFNGEAIMTSPLHRSGTDRCAEALNIIREKYDINPEIVINIQGDEPFIKPEQIRQIGSCFDDENVEIASLIMKIKDWKSLNDPDKVKVIINKERYALYFSRSAIPYVRNADKEKWLSYHTFYKHLGIYGYRAETLDRISSLHPSSLEKAEALEQNRWLENGLSIKCSITDWESIGVDTPEDLERAIKLMKTQK